MCVYICVCICVCIMGIVVKFDNSMFTFYPYIWP